MKNCRSKTAFFPGSFDPFTIGHLSIVMRSLSFADRVVIGIGVNDSKSPFLSIETREREIKKLFVNDDRVDVVVYSSLTIDAAKDVGADVIVRGVRSVVDFEYERDIAEVNRALSGMETLMLFALPEVSHVSSSIVRELARLGKDVSAFVPIPDNVNKY